MATIQNGKMTYMGGEAMPVLGSSEYKLSQSDPESLMNFRTANPGLNFDEQDMAAYNNAGNPNAKEVSLISSSGGKKVLNEYAQAHNADIQNLSNSNTSSDPYAGKTRIYNIETGDISYLNNPTDVAAPGWVKQDEANALGIKIPTPTGGADAYQAERESITRAFAPYMEAADAATKNYVTSLQSIYDERFKEQQAVNKSALGATRAQLMRIGGNRSRGGMNILTGVETKGLERLGQIKAEEAGLIAKAQEALNDKKYSMFIEQRSALNELRKERRATFEKLQNFALEEQKARREQARKDQETMQKNLDSILVDVAQNGAPDEVRAAVANATTLGEAVTAAGEYLQAGTGIIGEYNFYKKDALSRGLNPITFDEYQTKDSNRKVSIARASMPVAGTSLTPSELANFNRLADKYQASPAIKALENANNLKNIADAVIQDPSNAVSQLNLIYSYIKGLDTESAVKEGEIELVKSINSYMGKYQLIFDKVTSGKPITDEVALQIAKGAKDIIGTIESTAKRKQRDFTAQAKENGTNVAQSWQNYLSNISEMPSVGSEIVGTQARDTVDNYVKSNPEEAESIANLSDQGYDDAEIVEYLKRNGKLQ